MGYVLLFFVIFFGLLFIIAWIKSSWIQGANEGHYYKMRKIEEQNALLENELLRQKIAELEEKESSEQ